MSLPIIHKSKRYFPHQLEAIEYGLKTENPALLMEQRLGKTVCTSRIVRARGYRRILVLAPPDAMEGWERHLRSEGQEVIRAYKVPTKKRYQAIKDAWEVPRYGRRWLLLNYQSLVAMGERTVVTGRTYRDIPDIAFLPWDMVIADEVTAIRNPNVHTSKICLAGFRNATERMILTGLIDPESLLDVYNPFAFLDGSFLGCDSYWEFRSKHFINRRFEWRTLPGSRDRIHEEIHARAFVKTRHDAGIKDWKVREIRTVPMNKAQRDLQRKIVAEWNYGDDLETAVKHATVKEMWLWKIAGGFTPDNELISGAKRDAIIELLKGELQGNQVVIWFKFRHELAMMVDALNKAGIKTTFIIGDVPKEERDQRLNACRAGKYRVMCATELVAQFGNDFSFADTAFYYSNELSTLARAQSEDRFVNILKSVPLLLVDWVSEGSTDESVIPTIRMKHMTARMILMEYRRDFMRRLAAAIR